jgi:hypothetical protein
MKLSMLLSATLAVAFFASQAEVRAQSAPPTPTASISPDAAVMVRAKDWLHRLETGDIDRTQLSPQMSAFLTPDRAKQFAAQIGVLGDPTSFTFVSKQTMGGYTVYTYRAAFKGGVFNETFAIDSAGKIGGLRLSPPT